MSKKPSTQAPGFDSRRVIESQPVVVDRSSGQLADLIASVKSAVVNISATGHQSNAGIAAQQVADAVKPVGVDDNHRLLLLVDRAGSSRPVTVNPA